MDEQEVFRQINMIASTPQFSMLFGEDSDTARRLAEHKAWLDSIRNERPSLSTPARVGIYIRYFNQTKHEDYLSYHKKLFADTLALCPNWTLADYYIDEGNTAPNIESAPELCRLLEDAFAGKVDLIITQKVSSMSKKPDEITLIARLLAAQTPPVGIYFISEDIYTLASYYQYDLRDTDFLMTPPAVALPGDGTEAAT